MKVVYAHTKENEPEESWEELFGPSGHAERTASIACRWVSVFEKRLKDAREWLMALAIYHDMGKAKEEFQRYLRGFAPSISHKKDAAAFFCASEKVCGKFLSYAFMGHHSGLPDGVKMFSEELAHYEVSDEVLLSLPEEYSKPVTLQMPTFNDAENIVELSFSLVFFVRMLHSCLVDADWLATEEYMHPEDSLERKKCTFPAIKELSERLESYIFNQECAATGHIAKLRKQIHERCFSAAVEKPRVCRLNVPTGGGKTLSSLSYALRHAQINNLDRVIYVIPYTSIIEQTAEVFRSALGKENVLEHHSSLAEDSQFDHNRLATENWDAPVIVTTSVQFFESLYASRNKRCRKIHNISRSVIVLDEVQALPATRLAPCLAVLRELHRGYNCSLLLCTATQPSFENEATFNIGWKSGEIHSLLGSEFEKLLALNMKRVCVHRLGKMSQSSLLEHFLHQSQQSALFIVNLTRQAQSLFYVLRAAGIEGLFHLSARMCPAHRRDVLETVRHRLQAGEPVVLVSTRVVEAGVDVSFPLVYRDSCGLDSLAQSAGRCNRHGERDIGQVFVYDAVEKEFAVPRACVEMKNAIYALSDVLWGKEEVDISCPELIDSYFRAYYNKFDNWDIYQLMQDCVRGAQAKCEWNFPMMDEKFRMIDNSARTLLVPFGDESGKIRCELIRLQKAGLMPSRELYRKMQQYSVSVYDGDWPHLTKECINRDAEIYMLSDVCSYDMEVGLKNNFKMEYIY